jgi:pimeloyl-ACP methyl ester carboxylesterase
MTTSTRHLYLHGFASSPKSRKAVYLRDRMAPHGIALDIPDLNLPDFEHLTLTAMLAEAEARLPASDATIWGSSLGGYLATLLAHRHPTRVARLILLAPAFDFPSAFPLRVAGAEEAWAKRESVPVFHHREGREVPFSGSLRADCANYPSSPSATCPTLVIAASRDEVIAPEAIRGWVVRNPQARLEVVHDAHEMAESGPAIGDLAERFLGLRP